MPLSAAAKANPIIANDELQGKNSSHTGTTQATWKIRLVQVPIWFLLKLLPQHEFLKRRPEHVRFDELLHALIYWNLSFRFVPRSSIVSRSDLDKENVTCVAREKIGVLCCGVVTRYHLAKLLLLAETNFNHGQCQESVLMEAGSLASNHDENSYNYIVEHESIEKIMNYFLILGWMQPTSGKKKKRKVLLVAL